MRWFDQSQPQTLQIGVILLYINGVFGILGGLGGGLALVGLVLAIGQIAAAFGIANSKRAGWVAGIVLAIVLLGFQALSALLVITDPLLTLGVAGWVFFIVRIGFDIAMLVALVHPQSREYQKIWFG